MTCPSQIVCSANVDGALAVLTVALNEESRELRTMLYTHDGADGLLCAAPCRPGAVLRISHRGAKWCALCSGALDDNLQEP